MNTGTETPRGVVSVCNFDVLGVIGKINLIMEILQHSRFTAKCFTCVDLAHLHGNTQGSHLYYAMFYKRGNRGTGLRNNGLVSNLDLVQDLCV